MTETLTRRPGFTRAAAADLLREHYGLISQSIEPLPSERDQNFLVHTGDSHRILKIANSGADESLLQAQNRMMTHLACGNPPVPCPAPLPTIGGAELLSVSNPQGNAHWVRLLSYLPGSKLADCRRRPPELLREVGEFVGRLDQALASFDHPAVMRNFYWDLRRAPEEIGQRLEIVGDDNLRSLVAGVVEEFEGQVRPLEDDLPHQVIHNDANDHNLLVVRDEAGAPHVAGIIDFGDLVHSYRVAEPAITAAYAISGTPEPLEAMWQIVAGYHREVPLTEQEVSVFFTLVKARLATSIAVAASQSAELPDDPYLTVSHAGAVNSLRRLSQVNPRLAHYRLRAACGMEPVKQAAAVSSWIGDRRDEFKPILGTALECAKAPVLDLSPASPEIDRLDQLDDPAVWGDKIDRIMAKSGATIAIGRYAEPRLCYTGDQFLSDSEPRTVHLGQDLFGSAGTPVYLPLAGTVHSLRDNDRPLDYGPAVIVEHRPSEEIHFHTLYGHLSRGSISRLSPGQRLEAGAQIGRLGSQEENGGWPPHLHFQLIIDLLGYQGNFPGVAPATQRELWLGLSPDPGALLGLTGASWAAEQPTNELREARAGVMGPSLSLSYHEPLQIVRGWRQFLYDENGRPYLDCVNNVCHVGHCHPRVVEAVSRQMATLNTNTRYLHPSLAEYARRLCATLPDHLEVCYLVNSGSEANELALRMARCYTGAVDVMVLDHGYHGNTGALVDLSPYKHNGRGGQGPPEWVHTAPLPDPYRGAFTGPDAASRYAKAVQELVATSASSGRRLAAFMSEAASGCGGQVFPAPGCLSVAYRIAREAGAIRIADEVQTGFGRAGTHFWMFETEGVQPDIVTMGKPNGNGPPIGAVVTTREIAEAFDNGMEYFNTFGGNPVSCAAGLAVLDAVREDGLQQNARSTGSYLLDGLVELEARHPAIGDVRGRGLFLGVELVRDRASKKPASELASYVINRMRDRLILLSTDGPYSNVIKIKPPMVFSRHDADRLLAELDSILEETE